MAAEPGAAVELRPDVDLRPEANQPGAAIADGADEVKKVETSGTSRATAAPARSRRSLLLTGVGAVGAAIASALGLGEPARAAAGSPLVLGQTNFAGTAATRVNATSSGGAFWMTQNGSGSGVRADSPGGHGAVFTTQHADRYGLYAQQNASTAGAGAAVRAVGGGNAGVDATTDAAPAPGAGSVTAAVSGAATNTTGAAVGVYGIAAGDFGIGVLGRATTTSTSGAGVTGIGDANGFGGQFFGATALYAEANDGGTAAEFDGLFMMNGQERFVPIADPASAPGATVYARTNGSGKVELCVVFTTGAVHVLATEA